MDASELRPGEQVKGVHFTDDTMAVDLMDNRTTIVPLAWYLKLLDATSEQRGNWRISGAGYGTHWPDLDEDLSTEGLSAHRAGRGPTGQRPRIAAVVADR